MHFKAAFNAKAVYDITGKALFTTDATNLWDVYLKSFSDADRQHHNCAACRKFIERYGHVVTITPEGQTVSPLWASYVYEGEPLMSAAMQALNKAVSRAKVTGVFYSSEDVWGQDVTGMWMHMCVKPPAEHVFKNVLVTADQAMAAKREDFKNINVALSEYSLPLLNAAVKILEADALFRSEKVLGPATWLRDVKAGTEADKGRSVPTVKNGRQNRVWLAVATAPAGFCHPRSSMIGTLLDDLTVYGFDQAARRFNAKMNPLAYQRPTAAPSEGTIRQAEEIVSKLGAAGALDRRFCRLDEIEGAFYRHADPPSAAETISREVFGHLRKAENPVLPLVLPTKKMTWIKFQETVLPSADSIELYLAGMARYNLAPLITAVNPDATPILQWDGELRRNPVSWYVWVGGSTLHQFGLSVGYTKVLAITNKPCHWHGPFQHFKEGLLFVLEGAKDTRNEGAGLFPEILRSEFHGVRSVIEAHSRRQKVQETEGPLAQGLLVEKNEDWTEVTIRVTSGKDKATYKLDRWD